MASVFQRLRRISNQWRKNRREPSSPSSIADFPTSIEFVDNELRAPHQSTIAAKSELSNEANHSGSPIESLSSVSTNDIKAPREDREGSGLDVNDPLPRDKQSELSYEADHSGSPIESLSDVSSNSKKEPQEHSRDAELNVKHPSPRDEQQNESSNSPTREEQQHEACCEQTSKAESPDRRLVSIQKGKHKGKRGEIVGNYNKITYRIRLVLNDEGEGDIVNVRMASVVDEVKNPDPETLSTPSSAVTPRPLSVCDNHSNDQQYLSKPWIGLRVRDKATGSIGMVEDSVDDQTILLRLDDKDRLLRVPTNQLSPSREGTILPKEMMGLSVQASEEVRQQVRVLKGKHANKMVTIIGAGSRSDLVRVEIDGKICQVKRSSISTDTGSTDVGPTVLRENRAPLQDLRLENTRIARGANRDKGATSNKTREDSDRHASVDNDENTVPINDLLDQQVRIKAGKHFSKLAVVVGDGPKKNLLRVRIDDMICDVLRSSIEVDVTKTVVRDKRNTLQPAPRARRATGSPQQQRLLQSNVVSQQAQAWSLPNAIGAKVMTFGGRRIKRIRIDERSSTSEVTMLNVLFGDRLAYVEEVLNGRTNQTALDATVYDKGVKYELVSVRLTEEESGRFNKKKLLVCGYAATEGPELASLSLCDQLLRIADFSQLPPRKIASRLELFLSPARFSVYFANADDFCQIPETGNVGCGFISQEKLLEVCRDGGMGARAASCVVAIQVRIFFPAMGVFKGMLVRKRNMQIAIELPPSMQKVPASTHDNPWDGAAIVVCKNGVHPSPSSANEYIGRALDDSLKEPPTKSFEGKIQKELRDMILRLWISMGVPKGICIDYIKKSVKKDRRNHAWVVGVADPTGCLPPDTVFVPGMKNIQPKNLFVTRSPCVKYEDGRLLEHVVERPASVGDEDWKWLNMMSFGCIIFSNPRQDMMTLPERIAVGDLDGDLYLVCWDKEILSTMSAAPLRPLAQDDDGALSTIESDSAWLEKAHELMQDVGSLNGIGKLTGKLYTLGEKIADHSSDGLKDPDAAAFFDAYNQALEYKKHGRPIVLPQHLHCKVPQNLRSLLTDSM